MFNFLKNIGPTEILLIALILVVLFGSRIVARLARTSGETFREMKKIKKTFNEALEDKDTESHKKKTAASN